jgi:hypothetical protein
MSALTTTAILIANLLVGQVSDQDLFAFTITDVPLAGTPEDASSPMRLVDERGCCALGGALSFNRSVEDIQRQLVANPDQPHLYKSSFGKDAGVQGYIYTRRGGLIDLAHLRDIADYTRFFASECHQGAGGVTKLEFKEGGEVYLLVTPHTPNWVDAALIGAQLAYDRAVWHEIVTWFPGLGRGGLGGGILNDQHFSSFSPEDNFSNALGALVGYRAFIESARTSYSKAVDLHLVKVLNDLGAVEKDLTDLAIDCVKGIWWETLWPWESGSPPTKRKNLEALSPVKPWLVTDIAAGKRMSDEIGNPRAVEIRIPTEARRKPIFELAHLEIRNLADEVNTLIPGKQVVTRNDFPVMIEAIRKLVKEKYGDLGDKPGNSGASGYW